MAEADIKTAASDVDKFMDTVRAKAADIAARQAAAAEAFGKEWEELYASIPEGRLRAFTESAGVLAARQSAAQRKTDAEAEVNRFANKPVTGPLPLP